MTIFYHDPTTDKHYLKCGSETEELTGITREFVRELMQENEGLHSLLLLGSERADEVRSRIEEAEHNARQSQRGYRRVCDENNELRELAADLYVNLCNRESILSLMGITQTAQQKEAMSDLRNRLDKLGIERVSE